MTVSLPITTFHTAVVKPFRYVKDSSNPSAGTEGDHLVAIAVAIETCGLWLNAIRTARTSFPDPHLDSASFDGPSSFLPEATDRNRTRMSVPVLRLVVLFRASILGGQIGILEMHESGLSCWLPDEIRLCMCPASPIFCLRVCNSTCSRRYMCHAYYITCSSKEW